MEKFCADVIAATPNPQQVVWAAMHQDYSEHYVYDSREKWPDEERAGELIVKHLLSGDRGHYGPLEHPQITFNVGYFPHSMMQQIRTHRIGVSFDVQCLAGNTEITFVNGEGETNRKLKKTIGELYELWTNGEKAIRQRFIQGRNGEPPGEYRRDCKKRIQKMRLRVLNEESGLFEYGHIKDIMCNGIQPIYRIKLEDGKTLDCTVNHRLFTSEGWQTMGDAIGLVTSADGTVIKMTKPCFVMCNGVVVDDKKLYRDKIWLEQQIEKGLLIDEIAQLSNCSEYIHHHNKELEFAQSYKLILKPENWQQKPRPSGNKLKAHPVKVISVEYIGQQITYDLEVDDRWHNFVANGMVVHNSFRYTGERIINVAEGKQDIEDVFYLRPIGNYTNRQGKRYFYSEEQRAEDLNWCLEACRHYKKRIEEGLSEEHARGLIPFDARQHFVLSCNMRSLMHLLDLRWKKDAQLEAQKLCELLFLHFEQWSPAVAQWYKENRAKKAKLSP
ncbi:MAG TPA: FAD-dependent thymidylate synthase [Cyanobacteria bacterium UBA11370]|nr:FAD-dependent thymidylate synthase [Cyanobacteria bacterium UBA11370]HBY80008.1 FAD-dependent thymidylate synthase [Cyanobacteria bacterium UBA11148]